MTSSSEEVGYGKPPKSTQFKKGRSGNPRGRPRNRRREVPYDALLGQMVTIREDGHERRVTAAEAFLLHLTKKGLEGDNAAARASLAAIEAARMATRRDEPIIGGIVCHYVSPGSVGPALDALGMVEKLNRYSESAYYKLKPWIVQAALARVDEDQLMIEDQQIVLKATHSPQEVEWPSWWTVLP
jgi:hypothetical protein